MKHVNTTRRMCFRFRYFFYAAIIMLFIQMSLIYNLTDETNQRKLQLSFPSIFHMGKPRDRNKTNGPDPPDQPANGPVLTDHPAYGQDAREMLADNQYKVKPKCQISIKEAISAIRRAKTHSCKQEIADVTCLSVEGKLFPIKLPNFCPNKGNHSSGFYYGCFKDSRENRDLIHNTEFPKTNSPENCIKYCTNRGYLYAGLQYSVECFCGDRFGTHGKEDEDMCKGPPCPGDKTQNCGGYLTNRIFTTGLAAKVRTPVELAGPISSSAVKVKIVFVLTLSGRSVRQVKRLLRAIYHKDHYYYIHVDNRQDYLYSELLPLETLLPNLRLTKNRFATIWGGASLLQAHLAFIKELLEMTDWEWDYYINLSESDYPIKRLETVVNFLTRYNGHNFLKSHGRDTPKFLKKQGIGQMFYECDNHLWRLGPRELPAGIRFDGGSDWIGLHRKFCQYVVTSDQLLDGLQEFYKYTLLPVESFFHTVLQNSIFCETWLDNNLHVTNWNRKKGCKCQNKHIVDWCGCSPNDFLSSDLDRLLIFEQRPRFFARKFEPAVNQDIINSMDLFLFKDRQQDMKSFTSYWQNEYHHIDKPSNKTDSYLSFYGSFQRRGLDILKHQSCLLKPGRILESTAYFLQDHFNGVLLSYEAEHLQAGKKVVLESHLIQKRHFLNGDPEGPVGRLLNLEIGTDYDLKENIFRNFGQLIGPYSDITLKHSWNEGQPMTISAVWIDPINDIAASYDLEIPATIHIGSHKPEFHHPLRPGVWKIKLMFHWEVVAETSFLVLPLTTFQHKPVSLPYVMAYHNGPGGFYIGKDFYDFNKIVGVNKTSLLQNKAIQNGRKTGDGLNQWVDSLTKQFWEHVNVCVSAKTPIECLKIDICENTIWSSMSKDPKSEIHGVNQTSGYLH